MSGLSTYTQNALLNWIKGTAMPTAPAAVYVGLFSADPTDAGTGTEVTTTVRTAGRVAATFGAITGNTSIANSADVDFGAAAGGATASHFGLFSAATGGNLLASGALAEAKTIVATNLVKFATGALTLTVD
jgi:hypothetical protein